MSLSTLGKSDVHCSLLEWTGSKVKLVVANRGTRPAVVKSLNLVPDSTPPMSFRPDVEQQILEPNKYEVLTFTNVVDGVENPLRSLDAIKSKSSLHLVIFPFGSEPSEIKCANWDRFR
jgi:hypothetical protein